jgi:hypothetical protein
MTCRARKTFTRYVKIQPSAFARSQTPHKYRIFQGEVISCVCVCVIDELRYTRRCRLRCAIQETCRGEVTRIEA